MVKPLSYIFLLICGLSLFSCKNNIPPPNNKYELWKNEFHGNQSLTTDELLLLIPFAQRENSKTLKLPITPRVWWYNFGQNIFKENVAKAKLEENKQKLEELKKNPEYSTKKASKLDKSIQKIQNSLDNHINWFFGNIGEKQVYVSEDEIKETAGKIQRYLFDLGYRDAKVESSFIHHNDKVNVRYQVAENLLFTIDSLIYVTYDELIDSLFEANKAKRLLHVGDAFNFQTAELEKLRLVQLLKDNGYYAFDNRLITYGITNEEESEELFEERKHGHLKFDIANPGSETRHVRYTLNEVSFKTLDQNFRNPDVSPDTTFLQDIKFIRLGNSVPLKAISKRIITQPGELYNNTRVVETQRQISLFNQFSFTNSQFTIVDSARLNLEYLAPIRERYTFGISPGFNNIYSDGNSFFGFGVPVSLSMRNALRQLEIIEMGVRASYEGQPAPIQSNENTIRGSLELGGNLNITFPAILFVNFRDPKVNLKNPTTTFGLGYNYSEPYWGKRTNFKITSGNSLQLTSNAILYFNFLDAYVINTSYANNTAGKEFYNTLDSLQKIGNNLKVTFDPQFVSSINANFVFNNQNPGKPFSDSRFFRFFMESGGTVLNFIKNKERINFIENLFPLSSGPDSVRAYFRFVKINADFRENKNINAKSSYAYRLNLGLANPYGKNKALPYEKSFFAGGSNSVRAWAPRTLGTGSAPSDTTSLGNIIPQPGDVLLEGSIEYRLKVLNFAGNIQIASFVDVGNVWKWHPVNQPDKFNKSNFDFTRFYKELAVGTGFGIRWDLNYFLFRFDWGIKVFDPGRPEGDRFVLDEFSLRRKSKYGLNLNFGIGYPF